MSPPLTPDGRYIVVDSKDGARPWRASNPDLSTAQRQALVDQLMAARRAVHMAKGNAEAVRLARLEVDNAKRSLGERGAAWWSDGEPDFNRRLIANSPYADWWRTKTGD